MNNTNFVNPHGLDDPDHLTTSYDIALMSAELMSKYPEITNYTTIWTDSLRDGKSEISNTNKLLRSYQGITGLKTGSTALALYNLSATATRDDLSLIAIIMKAPSTQVRFEEAAQLLDFGFKNYSYYSYSKTDDIIATAEVSKSYIKTIELVSTSDTGALVETSKKDNVTTNIVVDSNIQAPIKEGDILGTIDFLLDNEIISTYPLVSTTSVSKLGIFTMGSSVISTWVNLLR